MRMRIKEPGVLFDVLLRKLATASKTTVRTLLKRGSIRVDGRVVRRPDYLVRGGQEVEIASRESRQRPDPPCRIIHEDEHLLVADKPAPLLTISTDQRRQDTLFARLYAYVEEGSRGRRRLYVVHRLDRDVSGIILFALSPEVKRYFQNHWREVTKKYWAIVEGRPPRPQGAIESWLRESAALRVYSGPEGSDAKWAITHYRTLAEGARYTALEVQLGTGRKHQIRVHLAESGCPVAGDKLYGARSDPLRRLGLHAVSMEFVHPVDGRTMALRSSLPRVMEAFMRTL